MEHINYVEILKKKLQSLFEKEDWSEKDFSEVFYATDSKIQVIWILNDWVKDGKYIEESMRVAEILKNDRDPIINSEEDKNAKDGKDINFIHTVRGSLPYLLEKITASLKTEYYTRILDVTEDLLNDKNIYVRAHAVTALLSLSYNVYATNRNDGTPFNFEDRERVRVLALRVLNENHVYPRVLEFVTRVFDRLRRLNENDAKVFFDYLLYKNIEEKTYNPDYVLENVAPLLIYYAEFRIKIKDNFNDTFFKELLISVIKTAPPRLKSTLVWHIWKVIEEDASCLGAFEKYIDIIFEGDFQKETVGQLEILMEKVFSIDQNLGIIIFKKYINYIEKRQTNEMLWLLSVQDFLPKIADFDADIFLESLKSLVGIWRKGNAYIGDYKNLFNSFTYIKEKTKRELVRYEVLKIFSEMHKIKSEVLESYED
ncbi:MAG: hypothetical protein WCQ32_02475 [bacterium]